MRLGTTDSSSQGKASSQARAAGGAGQSMGEGDVVGVSSSGGTRKAVGAVGAVGPGRGRHERHGSSWGVSLSDLVPRCSKRAAEDGACVRVCVCVCGLCVVLLV